jgi:predicted secreted protein
MRLARDVRTLGLAVACAAAIAGCAADASYRKYTIWRPFVPAPLVLDESVNGSTIHIPRTQTVLVRLSVAPSSGYEWNLAISGDLKFYPSGDTPKYTLDSATPDATASAGTAEYTFRADGVGKTSVRFTYIRPWDEVPVASKVVAFDVVTP